MNKNNKIFIIVSIVLFLLFYFYYYMYQYNKNDKYERYFNIFSHDHLLKLQDYLKNNNHNHIDVFEGYTNTTILNTPQYILPNTLIYFLPNTIHWSDEMYYISCKDETEIFYPEPNSSLTYPFGLKLSKNVGHKQIKVICATKL